MFYIMGVDLGTTNVKAAIFDENGKHVAEDSLEVPLRQPKPGWAEQDLNEILSVATSCIRNTLEKANIDPSKIVGIAFDGQMSGLGAVDKNLEPVMPFDSWLDTRCTPYIKKMYKYADLIIQRSGGAPGYSHGPKILRWKEEMPELFDKISKVVVPATYVASKLAGLKASDVFIDYTYLHFSNVCDLKNIRWDEELCQMFGIPAEKLPRIVKPWEIVGKLSKEASSKTGLLEGTPIIAGCGDQASAMLGVGIVEPYILFDSAGTASVLALSIDDFRPDMKHKVLLTARSVLPELWYAIAFINGGGQNLRWFRDVFAFSEKEVAKHLQRDPYEILNEEAERLSPGSDGIIFVPHLGGRMCPPQPHFRGVWFGFNWGHSKAGFYRSILEGIAYEYSFYLEIIKDLFPDASFKYTIVVGGGAKSDLWNKIKASVLEMPYVKVNRREGAVFGTAVLAGYGSGLIRDIKDFIKRVVTIEKTMEPVEEWKKVYERYRKFYRKLLIETDHLFLEFLEGECDHDRRN
ncbi:FGGY-family carbohydrate kinase [Thermotoga neapolitana]|jgi:xylulokinase|nr:FGGY family carbohydrate kinase [Thermotoga neapolitana]KFZ22191.1 hypothetical protein LA10_01797 [Thermotoga neapolitana LA10]KUK22700.1 MAG: Uncharacterized protein XD57_1203 [Thermotoga petrophila]